MRCDDGLNLLGRLIGRAVVDNEYLAWAVVARDDTLDGRRDIFLLVVRGDKNGDTAHVPPLGCGRTVPPSPQQQTQKPQRARNHQEEGEADGGDKHIPHDGKKIDIEPQHQLMERMERTIPQPAMHVGGCSRRIACDRYRVDEGACRRADHTHRRRVGVAWVDKMVARLEINDRGLRRVVEHPRECVRVKIFLRIQEPLQLRYLSASSRIGAAQNKGFRQRDVAGRREQLLERHDGVALRLEVCQHLRHRLGGVRVVMKEDDVPVGRKCQAVLEAVEHSLRSAREPVF